MEARLARMSMAIHEGHEGQTLALAAVEGLLPNPQHADNRLQNALTVPVPAEHAGKELEQLGLWGLRADVQASRSSMSLDTATPAMYMAPLLLARVMRRQAPWEGAPFSDSTGLTEEWETKHSIVSQPFPSPMADRPGGEDGAGQQLQLELDGQRGQAAAAPKNQAKAKAKARAIKVNRSPCWMAGRCVCKAQAAGKMRALRAAKFTRALKSMISADKNKYKELLSKGYVVLAVSCSHRRVAEQPDPLQNKPMDDTPNVHYFHVSFSSVAYNSSTWFAWKCRPPIVVGPCKRSQADLKLFLCLVAVPLPVAAMATIWNNPTAIQRHGCPCLEPCTSRLAPSHAFICATRCWSAPCHIY